MKIKKTLLAAALGASLLSATGAHAALTLTLGGNGVYDTDLNITWLQNANLAASNTFGVGGISSEGYMTWFTAQSWISAMNAANYLGFSDWRLPTVTDTGTPGCTNSMNGTDCGYNPNTATGEMAHLWYDELGNIAPYNTSGVHVPAIFGSGLTNTGPFSILSTDRYHWYGTEDAVNSMFAWDFKTSTGVQGVANKFSSYHAWAVRDGGVPVSAVPEPETYAMLLAGLGLMGFTARRRKNNAA